MIDKPFGSHRSAIAVYEVSPCPLEGNADACDRCWSSHADAVPYCTSLRYKRAIDERGLPVWLSARGRWEGGKP